MKSYQWFLVAATILFLICGYVRFRLETSPQWQAELKYVVGEELWVVSGSSVKAIVQPCWFKPQVYGTLVDCLSFYESTNNPLAVGQAGEIGILQFMPETWDFFCVKKYGLPDDIWNVEYQRRCSDYMLQDNLGHHWTTYKHCI